MNRTRLSILMLVAVALAATTLTGCGRRGFARVNGDKIKMQEFYKRLERATIQTPQGPQVAGEFIARQLIMERLIEQLAKEQNVAPTEEQINKKLDFLRKQSGGDIGRVLNQMGMTLDELKRQIAVEQSYINLVTKGVSIPDERVRKAYNEALRAKGSPFIRPEQVMLSAIITRSKDKIDKAYKLLQKGQEFGSVSRQLSDVWIKQTDGKVGWASKDGVIELVLGQKAGLPKDFAARLFSLPIGKYTPPFESVTRVNEGNRVVAIRQWVILKADQKRPKRITQFEEAKDRIRESLAMQEGTKKNDIEKQIQKFVKGSDIVISAAAYKDLAERIKQEADKALEVAKPIVTPGALNAPK
ncbi:MAG: peptidyl-prolyl cis-trans isomerase [Armatimonadetes bacterium]|nr:peptidyl-prolyl cis-trans isomerase [Armatimonadota bacterium]